MQKCKIDGLSLSDLSLSLNSGIVLRLYFLESVIYAAISLTILPSQISTNPLLLLFSHIYEFTHPAEIGSGLSLIQDYADRGVPPCSICHPPLMISFASSRDRFAAS